MAVVSMTGFARDEVAVGDQRWTWEVRSVNGRSLEIRIRLPSGFDALDPLVRRAVPEFCRRGNISVTLSTARAAGQERVRINRDLLDQLLAIGQDLQQRHGLEPVRLDGLLAVRGVVESGEQEQDGAATATEPLAAGLRQALGELRTMRAAEGAELAAHVQAHLAEIERLHAAASAAAGTQPDTLRARLRQQLEELLALTPSLPADRLAQEAALLIARSDVREELDRLAAHVTAARSLIAENCPIGRKLEFLCQEFNREANTLCSKSADIELTRIGLDLKSAIEQLREQVANIE